MASFENALQDNRVPGRLGDVRLRYDGGRLMGEARPPSWERRALPSLCVGMGLGCAVGAAVLVGARDGATPAFALGLLAAALVGLALKLEAHLGRRRFVLHFRSETLRLERLAWTPGATQAEQVPFDAVRAVHMVERPGPRYALVVEYALDDTEGPLRRAVLVEHIRPTETETLHRVWRLLSNAFGLRGAGLAGG
ncbi:hypothetical protein [Corallococcus macrosporus]|uniref:Uncharacterized protein n=1 Tax=Corallococcus macrosporus DSM 14697 TaxID=1189310 RepID=A0A250JTN2_9BACT|nr:hypothetical protein [Corallococcus macrosporus]ATB47028.1 hypothetical protein MYMAC_002633 [Corallococcus macrosporus DSM 14697]